jgi:hypothetical protein
MGKGWGKGRGWGEGGGMTQTLYAHMNKIKVPSQKMVGRVAQGIGTEFKLHYYKKKKTTPII